MSGVTVYIVPAWSDQAGQCRIVATDGNVKDATASYRNQPERWMEVGHMNSQGKVISLSRELQDAGLLQEMRDCEPLMAGGQFYVASPADRAAPEPMVMHYLSEKALNAAKLSPSEVAAKVKAGWAWHRLNPSFCTSGGAGVYSRALVSPAGDVAYVSDRAIGPDARGGLPEILIDGTLVPLTVPFEDKDRAKALGAVWISWRKTWACAPDQVEKFSEWIESDAERFDALGASSNANGGLQSDPPENRQRG